MLDALLRQYLSLIHILRLGEAAGLAAAESLNQGCAANELDGKVLKEKLL